ncbi:MAG: 6-phosphogluconolactonase, partial [Oceanicaulis sp.]
PDAETAAAALAAAVEARLREGLARRGRASLCASGGSTPKRLYEILREADLDWSKVNVVLADERWVDPGLAGSNETFLKTTLTTGRAASAQFVGLKTKAASPSEALDEIEQRLAAVPLPFDAVVLGMGADGHTLSWFPEADGLGHALDRDGRLAAAIEAERSEATGPFTARATLTLAALQGAKFCALLISGEDKRAAWRAAAGPGRVELAPVRALMRDAAIDLQSYWWP